MSSLLSSFAAAGVAAGVLASSAAAGGWIYGKPGAPWGVRLVLGWAALSVAGALLCAVGIAYPVAWIVVAAAVFGAGWWRTRRWPAAGATRRSWRVPEAWAAVPLGVYWVVAALAPETLYDAAGYHLGLPAEWLRLGGFPSRISFFELLPQGMESIFAYALAAGGGAGASRLIHLACLPATAGLLAAFASRCGIEASRGWAAGLVYASAPATLLYAASAYTDAAWSLSLVVSLFLFLEARETDDRRAWLAAGAAAGFGYAVKMPALLAVAAFLAVLAAERRWKQAGWFAAAAGVVASPWILRSWWRTGNPLAPMLNAFFPNPWFGPETDAYVRSVVTGALSPGAMLRGLLWEGGASGGFFGPALLLLPCALAAWRLPRLRPVLLAGLGSFVFFATNQTARYLLPAFALLSLCALAALPGRLARGFAWLCCILTLAPVARNYAKGQPEYWAEWPWRVVAGLESQEDFLRRRMPVYAFAEQVNRLVPSGAAIFDCAGLPQFYVRHVLPGHWTSRADMQMHQLFLDPSRSRAEAAEAARSRGIEWLALPPGAASVEWARDLMNGPALWGMREIGEANGYRLYRIGPP